MIEEDNSGRIRVLVIDRQTLTRQSLVTALCLARLDARGCAPDIREYEALRADFPAQVGLLSVDDGSSPQRVVGGLCRCLPDLRVIGVVPAGNPAVAYEVMRAGAVGCLPRTVGVDDIVVALRAVFSGYAVVAPALLQELLEASGHNGGRNASPMLTERQKRIVGGMSQGLTDAQIAKALGFTESLVKSEVKNILRKTGSRNRTGIVAVAIRRGLIS